MRKQVEAWHRSELTDVTAKAVIYEAFVDGKLARRAALPIPDRERIPDPRSAFRVIGAAVKTRARGRLDRACGNSVLPTRHLVESPDQIPGPSDDSRGRPHP
jgi:hypothetical protein